MGGVHGLTSCEVIKGVGFHHGRLLTGDLPGRPLLSTALYGLGHRQSSTGETHLCCCDVIVGVSFITSRWVWSRVQIYRRGSEKITDASWESLKKEVTVAVETEVINIGSY